ncbi:MULTISPECIES: DUF4142 domain-containing protein [Hymenobacter]|uniref:Putative membrane protein n=1 Tax=Hymenobacter mucosus TaxID=1411120 RepID=A0A238YUM6_9BACT|nr:MULTISPECIES: DUF4142 domain-containing protein [Hymenobacter]SNR74652.1 putative membrane protein [Hymenobacter mucosus]
MKRSFLGLAMAALLVTSACSNSNESSTATTDTAATDASMSGDTSGAAGAMNTGAMPDSAMGGGAAAADPNGPMAPHSTDAEFMQSAAASDQNEIQLSKLALEKGVTGMAKDHANLMIKDHTKSTSDLKPIAQKKNVTLPADMDAEHKAIAAEMRKLSGKEFETKYMQQMVTDHQKTLNTMVAHQKMTQDADLQGFIGTVTPVVQNHLTMFKQHAAM